METLLKVFWIVAVVLGSLLFFWIVVVRLAITMAKRFGHHLPCPAQFGWLIDNRIRRRWTHSVLDRAGLCPGERVLELGPGPGTFTVQAAQRVGPEGKVIAVDIQPEMIAKVERRVREAGLTNVETHTADAYHLPAAAESVDRAILISVLPEMPDQARALAELYRVLKVGGVLSITEEFLDPDYPLRVWTERRVEAGGFRLVERFGNFWVYTLNFRKTS